MTQNDCPQEIISEETKTDLETLEESSLLEHFYLAGGTGVALTLRHRTSYDLDFFTEDHFNENILLKKLAELGNFELERKTEGTIIGLFRNTRVSFFSYPYPLLLPLRILCGIHVADIIDIAGMKIDTVASRGSKKDFVDLYMIMKNGYSLEDLLGHFSKKYGGITYNMVHIKKGLVYFDDADRDEPPNMLVPIDWEDVKKTFREKVKKLM